jgi:serine/threonine-protein kinase RsbW
MLSGFQANEVNDIVVAVGEAVANVIEHAGSSRNFSVFAESDDQKLAIWVEDYGKGFEFDQRFVSRPVIDERGYGMYLMSHLMDRVELEKKQNHGSIIRLEKVKRAEVPNRMLRPFGAGFISFSLGQSV